MFFESIFKSIFLIIKKIINKEIIELSKNIILILNKVGCMS